MIASELRNKTPKQCKERWDFLNATPEERKRMKESAKRPAPELRRQALPVNRHNPSSQDQLMDTPPQKRNQSIEISNQSVQRPQAVPDNSFNLPSMNKSLNAPPQTKNQTMEVPKQLDPPQRYQELPDANFDLSSLDQFFNVTHQATKKSLEAPEPLERDLELQRLLEKGFDLPSNIQSLTDPAQATKQIVETPKHLVPDPELHKFLTPGFDPQSVNHPTNSLEQLLHQMKFNGAMQESSQPFSQPSQSGLAQIGSTDDSFMNELFNSGAFASQPQAATPKSSNSLPSQASTALNFNDGSHFQNNPAFSESGFPNTHSFLPPASREYSTPTATEGKSVASRGLSRQTPQRRLSEMTADNESKPSALSKITCALLLIPKGRQGSKSSRLQTCSDRTLSLFRRFRRSAKSHRSFPRASMPTNF